MSKTILTIKNLEKTFSAAAETLTILKNLNLEVSTGQKVVITGESGSGKSTLLNIIGGLDTATKGKVIAGKFMVTDLDENELSAYRSQFLGLIFQFHYLLKDFNALENVFLPAYMNGMPRKEAMQKARQLLCDVGMEHRLTHTPSKLSGGERQRVAVARSLINDPSLVLADEPTGNLDPENATIVSDMLFSLAERYNKTLILVTHDMDLATRGDVHFKVEKGNLVLV